MLRMAARQPDGVSVFGFPADSGMPRVAAAPARLMVPDIIELTREIVALPPVGRNATGLDFLVDA